MNNQHCVSREYHTESQGALEWWHQTLKGMLRKYCLEKKKDWGEGVPFMLFAACEAMQGSLGFSPAQLVFSHTLWGLAKSLQESFLSSSLSLSNVLDHVSHFSQTPLSCKLILKTVTFRHAENNEMSYDRSAVLRNLHVGDNVLVLLPKDSSTLSDRPLIENVSPTFVNLIF